MPLVLSCKQHSLDNGIICVHCHTLLQIDQTQLLSKENVSRSIESFGGGGAVPVANANGAPNPQPTSTLPSFLAIGGSTSSNSSSNNDATAINTLWFDDGDSTASAEGDLALPPVQSNGRRRQLRQLQELQHER